MKYLIYLLTLISIGIALTFVFLVYRHQQTVPEIIEQPVVQETETDIAKRILVDQLETANLNPEEKAVAVASAQQQSDDDARLYDMAIAAGTVVPTTTIQFAWQREIYTHTDEAGLAAYITSLGLTEEQYRALVLRRLTTATFIETKAAARVSDADVRKYYDALPAEEQENFEIVSLDIRDNLVAIETAKVRKELLAQ